MKLIVLNLGLILSMFVAPFYAQATETVTSVDFPCRDSSSGTCQVGLDACEKIVPTISSQVTEKAEDEIKYAYQGVNIDYTLTTDAAQPKGTKVKRLCNAAMNEGVGKRTNDYQQDCGDFADLSGKPITIKLDGREKSFLRGAKIQAKRCYLKQIQDELASRKLRVTNEACQALAQDVDALTKRNRSVASAATEDAGQSFCQETSDMSGADFCREGASSTDPEKMKHLQATCHVAAASSATASAYGHLATCELNARTERAYTLTFYTESAHSSLMDKITSEVGKNCEKEAKNKCNDWSRTCLTREGQACYERELPKWMKEYLNEKFPSSGQCAQNTENTGSQGGLPFLPILPFMMGSLRRQSNRNKKAGKAAVVILSAAFTLLGAGCSDICEKYEGTTEDAVRKEMETEENKSDNILTADSTKDEGDWGYVEGSEDAQDADRVDEHLAEWKDAGCEIAEDSADPEDECCEGSTDCGSCSDDGGDSSGASSTRTAAASLGNAESFVGEDEAVASAGSPETSAATAGDSGDTSYGSGKSSDDTATAANRNIAGGGSDSGAGSGGGGSGLGSLDASSGGSSAASAEESAATVGDESPGSAYSSGGAPGGGSKSKKKSDNPFANLFGAKPGEGAGSVGANEMSFGAASADGGAMQSMDPANYFSLIDVNANIFQVVEKRYQKKSMDWALAQAKGQH